MSFEDDNLALARSEALEDTGYLARNFLGYTYDEDEKTGKRVPGGIRPDGPHKEMVDLLDRPSKWKHLEAPRASYKTTLLKCYVIRRLLKNPNERVLWASATKDFAKECVRSIRDELERNTKLVQTFGPFREKGQLWKDEKFTIAGRTDIGITDPSVWCEAVDTNFTGGHPTIMILDDIVNWDNSKTPEGVAKIRRFFGMCLPLLVPGGTLVLNGTRYYEDDLSGHVLQHMKSEFDILILDCGMDPQQSESGKLSLVGKPRFRHLTKEYLERRLFGMAGDHRTGDVRDFQSQYNNKITGIGISLFKRNQFRRMKWENWMQGMRSYLITDTATLEEERGCYSVVGMVGIDKNRCAYLFDLAIGHWTPADFERNFCDMLERWRNQLDIAGQCMEKTTLNNVFKAGLEKEARRRQLTLHFIATPRGKGQQNKEQRIQGLSTRFANGDFVVMDSVPRYFQDLGRREMLFDPEGFTDDDGVMLPGGELVNEFVRFPSYGRRDIADAIADIDMTDKEHRWLCPGGSRKPHRGGQPFSGAFVRQRVNGQLINVAISPMQTSGSRRTMWSRLAERARSRQST